MERNSDGRELNQLQNEGIQWRYAKFLPFEGLTGRPNGFCLLVLCKHDTSGTILDVLHQVQNSQQVCLALCSTNERPPAQTSGVKIASELKC